MRTNRRVALIELPLGALFCALLFCGLAAASIPDTPTKTGAPTWKASPEPRTDLLTNESLHPIAVFAGAVVAYQLQQAAAAQAAAAEAAAAEAAAQAAAQQAATTAQAAASTPSTSAASSATTTPTPAPSTTTDASGIPAAWMPTAICEEGGRDDPNYGFFGIIAWDGFDGYASAGAAPLSVQLAWEAAHGQGPPDAPGQCHSY